MTHQHSKYKFLAKNISWLFLGRVMAKLLALVTLPIITSYLDPQSYGIIALFLVEAALFAGIFALGLSSFATRMVYKYERTNPEKCRQYLGVTLFYVGIFSLIGTILCWPLAGVLKNVFFRDVVFSHEWLIYVPLIYAFSLCFYGYTTNCFLSLQHNKKIFLCEMMEFLLTFPVQIVGLVWFGFGWVEIVVIQLVAKVTTTIYSLYLLRENLGFSFKRLAVIKTALLYSLPYVPLNFSAWIHEQIDKVILGNMASLSSVGVYTIGNKVSEAFSFISRPITTTLKPEISKRLDRKEGNIQNDIKEFFEVFFQVSVFIIFAISIFTKEIVFLVVESRYWGAYLVVPALMVAYFLAELSGVFHLKFVYKNKTIFFPIVTVVGAVVNAGLNLYLVPRYNIAGAAAASVLTSGVVFFLCYILSQRLHESRYDLVKNFASLGAVMVFIFIIQTFVGISLAGIVFKLLVSLAYGLFLWKYLWKYNTRFRGASQAIVKSISLKFA